MTNLIMHLTLLESHWRKKFIIIFYSDPDAVFSTIKISKE